MGNDRFYEKISERISQSDEYLNLRNTLKELTQEIEGTIYVIENPLYSLNGQQEEDSSGSFSILIPKTNIIFTHLSNVNKNDFDDYVGNYIDSITTLSEMFEFKKKVGNSRRWNHLITDDLDISQITKQVISDYHVEGDDNDTLKILVSLITGSINTPDKGGPVENLLDAVKKRIVQFDGDQTRFVYDDLKKKRISIQGLAGTGKTELLFHRLVNLYTQTKSNIAFTCYSKVLANDIAKRIPVFFDRMKISERSDIDERVKVMSSWGSLYNPNSGFYRYICAKYKINFINLNDSGYMGFDGVCRLAVDQIKKLQQMGDFEPCFGYVLVDEAQDFPDSFFELCQLVASEQVILASDIFQEIFKRKSKTIQKPDFTLNKVYRTDPRNFMFSQFLGFGIKDKPIIKWLEDNAWKTSGYTIKKDEEGENQFYNFSREPLNRFSDINSDTVVPTKLFLKKDNDSIVSLVKQIIVDIKTKFPNVEPGDIGIVFLSKQNVGYELANMVSTMIITEFGWRTQKIYESKDRARRKKRVFISNQNNVKGLEFSFLIGIVLDKITDDVNVRNTVYMMMTRSFLTSYLILGSSNSQIYQEYTPLLEEILTTGTAKIKKPSSEEVINEEDLKNMVESSLTFEQKVEKVLNELGLFNSVNLKQAKNLVAILNGDTTASVKEIQEIIETNRKHFE